MCVCGGGGGLFTFFMSGAVGNFIELFSDEKMLDLMFLISVYFLINLQLKENDKTLTIDISIFDTISNVIVIYWHGGLYRDCLILKKGHSEIS